MTTLETALIPIPNRRIRKPCFAFMVLAFLGFAFSLPILNSSETPIKQFLFLQIRNTSICGIITAFEIMLLISIVVFFGKIGFLTSCILGTINLIFCIIAIVKTQELNSIPGIIMTIVAFLVNKLIYSYSKKLNRQNTKLQEYYKNLKEKQASLHKLAYYDYLTELPNRRNMTETISSLCSSQDVDAFKFVVIDIKNFKRISDVAGHQKGDAFLLQLISNWSEIIAKEDILGRMDGTEFALIIPRQINSEDLYDYINELKNCITHKMPCLGTLATTANNHSCNSGQLISANFGIVSYPEHGRTSEEILQFADTALSVSKEEGSNAICYFNQSMYDSLLNRTIMESALSYSIENNECYLMFQPQYETDSKKLRGFETLVRWKNNTLGQIPPSVFIPLAEDNGYILTLGTWILRSALEQFQHLLTLYPSDIMVSINLSVLQLLHPRFLQTLIQILSETGFDPTRLELEITESIFITSKEEVISILNEIKDLGIQIALDDFGTGYSSLSYLKDLPFDVIKMDKSFVDTITEDRKKAQLVDTILAIAKQLGYKVVAEGVETQDQLSYLKERSCDYIQGYLWGKPLVFEDVIPLLSEHCDQVS